MPPMSRMSCRRSCPHCFEGGNLCRVPHAFYRPKFESDVVSDAMKINERHYGRQKRPDFTATQDYQKDRIAGHEQ